MFLLVRAALLWCALLRLPLGTHREPLLAPLLLQLLEVAHRRTGPHLVPFPLRRRDVARNVDDRGLEFSALPLEPSPLGRPLKSSVRLESLFFGKAPADVGLEASPLERGDGRPLVPRGLTIEALRLEAPMIHTRSMPVLGQEFVLEFRPARAPTHDLIRTGFEVVELAGLRLESGRSEPAGRAQDVRVVIAPIASATRLVQADVSGEPVSADKLASEVVAVVQSLRKLDLKKTPGISETLDWVKALTLLNVQSLDQDLVSETLDTIVKYEGDVRKAQEELKEYVRRAKTRRGSDAGSPGPGPASDKDLLN